MKRILLSALLGLVVVATMLVTVTASDCVDRCQQASEIACGIDERMEQSVCQVALNACLGKCGRNEASAGIFPVEVPPTAVQVSIPTSPTAPETIPIVTTPTFNLPSLYGQDLTGIIGPDGKLSCGNLCDKAAEGCTSAPEECAFARTVCVEQCSGKKYSCEELCIQVGDFCVKKGEKNCDKAVMYCKQQCDAAPQPPVRPEKQVLCACNPCGQQECVAKDIQDCPAAQKAEQGGGKVDLYGGSRTIEGGSWKGGVERTATGQFKGTCKGCSNLFPAVITDVAANDASACPRICDSACQTYLASNVVRAQQTAQQAAKECFDHIVDACATVGTPAAGKLVKTGATDDQEKQAEGVGVAQEKVEKSPDGFVTRVFTWLKDTVLSIFGKKARVGPRVPEKKQKLCNCMCKEECVVRTLDGCSSMERAERQGGKFTQFGASGKTQVAGGSAAWSSDLHKQGTRVVGECTGCMPAANVVDVAVPEGNACEPACATACDKRGAAKAATTAAQDCMQRLQSACA